MALQGTLKDFSLADIFQLIGLQKKTGVLTLKSGQEVVTVSFLDGNVVAADSLHRRLEERLGYDRENVVPLSAESILMEGARILDEWPIIEKRIGSLATIYRRTPAAQEALAA